MPGVPEIVLGVVVAPQHESVDRVTADDAVNDPPALKDAVGNVVGDYVAHPIRPLLLHDDEVPAVERGKHASAANDDVIDATAEEFRTEPQSPSQQGQYGKCKPQVTEKPGVVNPQPGDAIGLQVH